MNVEQVLDVVKEECCMFDAVYEDYILELVGDEGLQILKEHNLVETCGVINGRQLYVLCK